MSDSTAPGVTTRKLTRPQAVWITLIASMTVASAALSFATGPSRAQGDSLPGAFELAPTQASGIRAIIDAVQIEPGRWDGIVIHHSGAMQGSGASIGRQHEAQGIRGLGYHMVIGNGHGAPDGEAFVGYRWQQQLPGAHLAGTMPQDEKNRKIGICLVGDGDTKPFTDDQMSTLAALVRELQSALDIPDEAVTLHRDLADSTTSPGRLFPTARFRRTLAAQ